MLLCKEQSKRIEAEQGAPQPLCRERHCRCTERVAVQKALLCRESAWLRQRRAWLLLAWGVPREWDESLSLKVRTEEWLSDFSLDLGLDFHFRTKGPKRRSVITWEVKINKNPPTGQEPVQLLVFPVFRLNRPVFTVLPVFNIFPVFCHNRTGLEAGSQLNRSDRPVRSGF